MKKALILLLTLLATATVWADDFITDVMVIGGNEDETNTLKNSLRAEGWTVITKDLNADAGGDYIFLLYKTGSNENSDAGAFITDFYISTESGTAPNIVEHNGHTYHLVNFDGGSDFIRKKGDLNSNAGGAYIHLYYTKDDDTDYSSTAINSISFSATASGGVCENGGSTPCDLNKGCGSSSEYIYMHVNSASKGWLINTNGTQCTITGYAGNKSDKTAITIPLTIDGAMVSGFSGQVFSGFNNLVTITFNENTIITQMPSMQGCNNFKHVKTGTANNQTPLSMTSISAYAFAGTALETIDMPSVTNLGEHAFEGTNLKTINMLSVTNVGEYAFAGTALETIIMPSVTNLGEHAFEGCRFYQITLPACLTRIGSYAFSNCSTLTDIYFDGTQQQWNNVTKGDDWKPNATIEHWHCTVTFNSNGHGTAPAAQNIVWSNQDKAVEPTAPTATGYAFLGWYTDADGNNQWDFNNIVTGDMTLYAKWEPQYTFNSETGELTLIWGEFNSGNKWGEDVPAEAVLSVTATSRVSFTGNCGNLFAGFTNCTSMDLKNINTSDCIDMSYMFSGCSSLTSLDLSGWNTGYVTGMSSMFSGCSSLTSLDLSGWNTGNVTDMNYMFEKCRILTSLDLSGWNTGNVKDMNNMFSDCKKLTSLNLSGWNTGNVIYMNSMFKYCKNLTSLDLSGWNTGNVTNMEYMFSNCSDLTSINLYGWNTSNVTKMNKMFYKCSKLTKLNLAEWNTSNVSEMSNMFYDCSKLTTIYVGDGWTTENITSSDGMFSGCNSLVGGMGTTFNAGYTDKDYAHIDGGTDNPGYLTAVPPRYTYDSETGALTLIWGEFNNSNKWGDDVPASDVKSVTATSDVSFTGNCGTLFYYFTSCTSMDLKNVNTDNCTNMRYMFRSCTSLTSLDLSGWNTANVTDMCSMFGCCTSMTSLDLTGWNTGKVTDMNNMFQLCSSLSSLNLSGWNTGNVTSMGWMFYSCSSLTSLDLSGWNTANVTDMEEMFYECSNLTTLEGISNWNTASVINMSGMFRECSSLDTLDLAGWNTGNVIDMNEMFYDCSNLTTLEGILNWNTDRVTNMSGMFRECSSLDTLDLSGWNTGKVTDMSEMFYDCSNLTTIYVGDGWNTGRVNISAYMFRNCNSLVGGMGTTYDEDHIDAEYAHIDGGPDNPGYLTEVPPRYTYDSETGVLALNWGEFNDDNKWGDDVPAEAVLSVTATSDVSFTGNCRKLFSSFTSCTSMDLKNINTSNCNEMGSMFSSCSSLTSLDLSGWNTGKIKDMNSMFFGCWNLTTLNLSGWNTGKVENMSSMFDECWNLTTLNLSGWNTGKVKNMYKMFFACRNLTTLNLSEWDTGKVENMYKMFSNCSSLTTIYVGDSWSTENVTNSIKMFLGCNSLVGGLGTTYDENHTDAEYAHIDGGPGNPGYFTADNTQIMLESVQFADNHFATWYGAQNLSVPEGLEAYVVSAVEDDKAIIVPVDYLPAGVGVLLYSATACENIYTVKYHGTTETVTSLLVGSLEPQTVTDGYLLYNDSFVRAQSGTTLPAHRCYLQLENPSSAPSLLRIIRHDDGVITGIDNVTIQYNKTGRYNLMGQPVGPDYRGIVIQNGKKRIIK